ncbi:unnamed protein product, partial [Rotaria sp. Silwood2]
MLSITAEQLGIDISLIRLPETARDKISNITPIVESLSSNLYSPALIDACQQLRKKLVPVKFKHPTLTWRILIEQAYYE